VTACELRAVAATSSPWASAWRAIAAPRPFDDPVMNQVLMSFSSC
jgi:hypothetical protein